MESEEEGGRRPLLARMVGIDPRSLAATRIAVALMGLWDLAARAPNLVAHYTDAGTFPRADLLRWFDQWHDWTVCVHLAGGSTWFAAAIFTVHALALLALLAGWRSRAAAFSCWLLFASLTSRNPFLSYGGDVLLRLLLFWFVFVPVGRAWSLDALVARREDPRSEEDPCAPVVSIGALGLLVQVALVLLFAGLPKAGTTQWSSGMGLAWALDQEEVTRTLGWVLRDHLDLTSWLDHAVLGIEIGVPFLVFAPFVAVRAACLLATWGMLAGIASTMWVGVFPFLMAASMLLFVPGQAWDRVLPRLALPWSRRLASHGEELAGRLRPRRSPLWKAPRLRRAGRVAAEGLAAVCLVYVVAWNVGLWRNAAYEPPAPLAALGRVLQLRQSWGMFGEFSRTGWFVIPGRLADGREVDLAVAGGPLPSLEQALASPVSWERPAFVPDVFADVHWFAQFRVMREYPDQDGHFVHYGRYLCREWNRLHGGNDALSGFDIVFVHRDVGANLGRRPVTADYERSVLWRHDCWN